MNSDFTIVLPDSEILFRVCGTNDSNLKLIESHLGVPVFTRGNEISIDAEDSEIRRQFKFIVDRIVDEVSEGGDSSEDMVESILVGGMGGGPAGAFSAGRNAISIAGGVRRIYPRTRGQAELIRAFRTDDVVLASGPAGSGKTFLAVAEALSLVLSKKLSRLVLTRPVVEAGESLGYLPGDLEDKISPYLRPLYDSMARCVPRETVRRLEEHGMVEASPLAYMRGRTLSDCAVILDEAQNTTPEQMKMFLTRMGENSKVFITGDVTQIDLPKRHGSGLVQALRILRGVPGVGIVELHGADVVRSALVKRIVQAYENEEPEQ